MKKFPGNMHCVLLVQLLLASSTVTAADSGDADLMLSAKIQLAFDQNDSYENALIHVNSVNGFILLTGQVLDAQLKDKAVNTFAFTSKDIRRIFNQIKVVDSIDTSTTGSDVELKSRIESALAVNAPELADKVTVVVQSAEVYLLGALTSSQIAKVGSTVSPVKGIVNIVTAFESVTE